MSADWANRVLRPVQLEKKFGLPYIGRRELLRLIEEAFKKSDAGIRCRMGEEE
jgi:hypothetical protein